MKKNLLFAVFFSICICAFATHRNSNTELRVPPTVTTNPSNTEVCEGETATFTADGTGADTYIWQIDVGAGWTNLSDDTTYAGVSTTTLTITNPVFSMDQYDYRLELSNMDGSIATTPANLKVEELPDASVSATNATCAISTGAITFTFSDNDTRSNIEFSIDGGSSYSYNYQDTTSPQTVSNLSPDTYNVWVRWGNNECPVDLGDYTINSETSPLAIFNSSTDTSCGLSNGSLSFTLFDIPTRTEISFSTNNGSTYDYTFNDSSGTGTISDLATGDYDVWISYNGDCPTSLGQYTINSGSSAATATIGTVDAATGNSDGRLLLSFSDDATQTAIEFSIDGGVNYDYSFDDTLGSAEISSLAANTYAIWVRHGDGTCASDLGNFTINEVEYTSIPDSNFESVLNGLGYDNYLGDNKVPTALIEVVTTLTASFEDITDFTGVEDFIALESLTVSYNSFTDLDVSNNVNLTFLNCGYSTLTSLDVSNNVLLETLWVNSSSISALDLSLNTSLTSLTASGMSNLTSLNMQNGNNTNVTNFTTLSAPNLSCILIDDVANTSNFANVDAGTSFSDTAYCEYTAIPDANFEAALEALGYDDISGDGQVPTALIEVVTSLDIRSLSIADLTGLEDFTALVTLLCRASGIETIDVSQNLLLETLTANNNSIATIDLSNNTVLKSINLGANSLTTLDVSNNTALTSLSLQSNGGLTSIDISNNILLTELKTYSSNIAALDLSNNPLLNTVQAYSTPMTTIDVSNNPDIQDLRVHNTSITELDLSNNPDIEQLRVNDTNITTLDLSNLVALERLYANDMSLSSLNVQNGNNNNVTVFRLTDNPSLSCILVDDADYSTDNWDEIDTGLMFSDTYCRYTAIPDANFEAELETLGYDDISADGQVPTELIEVVTSLNVSNNGITDITGIEDFVALTNLNVSNNTIGTLDVTNNINLTALTASSCSLTSLDISQNTALQQLNVHSNQLTVLETDINTVLNSIIVYGNLIATADFSTNILLETLDLFQNNLTTLDVRNNTVLTKLFCDSNQLTNLNIQNGNNTNFTEFNATSNSNLTCIIIDDTSNTSNLANIDLGVIFSETYCNYTAIPDANFEAALEALGYDDITADGQVPTALIETVTTLSVLEKSIVNLTGIEDFAALTSLDVRRNDLTDLDVSNNTLLETLLCQENAVLANLNVSNNLALTMLVCDGNQLATLDISSCIALVDINLSNNPITNVNTDTNIVLETFTAENTSLEALDFSNNPALIELEVINSNLRSLNVQNGNNTNVSDFYVTGSPALSCILVDDAAYSTTNWTDIDTHISFSNTACLDYTYVPDDNFEASLEALGYDNVSNDNFVPTASIIAVTSLNLRDDNIADLTGIEDFQALTYLNASKNLLTSVDISDNTALETLFLSENQLTSVDVSNNTNLTYLDIGENMISTVDVSNNTALTILEASDNNFTALDVTALPSLESLYFSDNNIATIDVSNNILLRNFGADNCALTSFDASGLANLESISIQSNPDIETLNVTGATSLTHLVIRNGKLAAADVSTNVNLEIIFLDGHQFTSFDMTNNPLVSILIIGSNPLLHTLDLRNGDIETLTSFQSTGNDVLTCINVDNPFYATNNLTNIDAHTSFGINECGVYAYVPDDNFEAALGVLGYDDVSNDNQIPLVNIDMLTTLDVSGEGIIDLTGIEEFVALTDLNLSGNAIVTADFSTNPLISVLNIANNQIVELDLSSNTALTSINVSQNELVSLNIQNGINTSITNFDATTNANLICILVDVAAYSTTNWTNIDLQTVFNETDCTQYTAIPDANFEAALDALGYDNISGDGQVPTLNINTITSLNVASESIADLTGIQDFVALTTLDCSLNTLTTIDVSNNINLVDLDADENLFTAIDISNNTLLQDLDLDNCMIESIDLSANTQLVDIDLQGNFLTAIDLSTNLLLEVIDLETNDLTSLDVANNLLLEELDIEDNEVATLILPTSTSLLDLDATNNMITSIDVSTYINLQILDLDENQLTTVDVSLNTALTRLKVNDNNLLSLSINNGNNTSLATFNATNNIDLYCILVDDEAYSTSNFTSKDAQASYNETSCDFVIVDVDVFLQGALINPNTGEEDLMRDDLRVAGGLYGSNSPYGDGASMTESVGLSDAGGNSTVDWIWVELRQKSDSQIVVAAQSAILQRDGDIVATDEDLVTPLTFENVPAGDYFIVVKHRNHLGIMSETAITLKQVSTTIDFTDANNEITFGSNAQTTFGMPTDVVAMWCGDANEDSIVQYSGTDPDTPDILSTVLNDAGNFLNFPTYVVSGYDANDVNMDGNVQYSGTDPDTPFILQNVLAHPNNSLGFSTYQIIEQLPENE